MKAIEEIAHTAAWQIYEEIGMSKHSVERMEEIISERLTEQKKNDIDKAWRFIEVTIIREGHASEDFVKEMNWRFKKAMEANNQSGRI